MSKRVFDPRIPPKPNLSIEKQLWDSGALNIAGVDEAGRGPLAGPVVAACVILPPEPELEQSLSPINDSKKLSHKKRLICLELIQEYSVEIQTGIVSCKEIDQIGILNATREAVWRAVSKLETDVNHYLLDYLLLTEITAPQTSLPKGDARSLTIACASIVAKETRDDLMLEYHLKYPEYGFAQHKGYGTKKHREQIELLGPCPIHRLSFHPFIPREENDP